jgi:hypothetical protein
MQQQRQATARKMHCCSTMQCSMLLQQLYYARKLQQLPSAAMLHPKRTAVQHNAQSCNINNVANLAGSDQPRPFLQGLWHKSELKHKYGSGDQSRSKTCVN